MRNKECSKDVGVIILAAGASSRLGSPKQLLHFRGVSLLRHAVLAALGTSCRPVIVVTGARAELSRRELDGLDVQEVLNPDWETGMAPSVRAGLDALLNMDAELEAVVFIVCDQPYLTADVICGLVEAHRATGKSIVASTYNDSYGVPALFSRAHFCELAGLEGAAGARQVIKKYAARAHFLPFPGGELDIDTPDDVTRLINGSGAIATERRTENE